MFNKVIVPGFVLTFSLAHLAPARAQGDVANEGEATSTAARIEKQCDLADADRWSQAALAAVASSPMAV